MAATFTFYEDNGASPGSRTAVTNCNWKNIDDATSAYSAYPIQANSPSYSKYQYGNFTGTFNQISLCYFAHTAGVLGTGLTLKGTVTSTYAQPTNTINAALTTDMTAVISAGSITSSGLPVKFSTVGPTDTGATTTLSSAGFTQYLVTQLQTSLSALPGDTATVTLTLQYNEN